MTKAVLTKQRGIPADAPPGRACFSRWSIDDGTTHGTVFYEDLQSLHKDGAHEVAHILRNQGDDMHRGHWFCGLSPYENWTFFPNMHLRAIEISTAQALDLARDGQPVVVQL